MSNNNPNYLQVREAACRLTADEYPSRLQGGVFNQFQDACMVAEAFLELTKPATPSKPLDSTNYAVSLPAAWVEWRAKRVDDIKCDYPGNGMAEEVDVIFKAAVQKRASNKINLDKEFVLSHHSNAECVKSKLGVFNVVVRQAGYLGSDSEAGAWESAARSIRGVALGQADEDFVKSKCESVKRSEQFNVRQGSVADLTVQLKSTRTCITVQRESQSECYSVVAAMIRAIQ